MHSFTSLFLASCVGVAFATPAPIKIDFARETVAQFEKRTAGYVGVTLDQRESNMRYLANVSVGTPPQQFQLIVDTGSSDLWLPYAQSQLCTSNQNPCVWGTFKPAQSSTFVRYSGVLGEIGAFNISYDSANSGEVGYYFNDTVQVGGQTLPDFTIGLAIDDSIGQGLLGVGFASLESVVSNSNGTIVFPTVIDHMVEQGLIERAAFSLYLDDLDASTGSILFGGIDSSKYTGDLVGLPMQLDSQIDYIDRYLVTLTSISFVDADGTHPLSDSSMDSVALLDSGTPLMVLPQNIANAIYKGVGAVVYDSQTTLIPCDYANADASLSFGFGGPGGPVINVPMSELVFRGGINSQYTFDNGDSICLFGVQGSAATLDGSLILGDTFLRSAYVVYDLENNEVAIAQASYNKGAEDIKVIPAGSGLPGVSSVAAETATLAAPLTAYPSAAPTSAAPTHLTEPKPTFDLGSGTTAPPTGAAGTNTAAAPAATTSSATGSSNAAASVVHGATLVDGQGIVAATVALGLLSLICSFVL